MQEERRKVLEDALKRIKKEFGEGSVMFLGEKPAEEIPTISTGSIQIDRATGVGGIPRGRNTEIYRPESSG